jgi:hypothetical protein
MGIVHIPCRSGGGPLDLQQSGGHHSWEGFPMDRGVADSSNDDSRRGGQQVTVAQSIIYVLLIM